jgi:hypothetical protein
MEGQTPELYEMGGFKKIRLRLLTVMTPPHISLSCVAKLDFVTPLQTLLF